MTIKDFKPGQEVFTLSTTRGRTVNHTIRKHIVKSVGRKYVKVVAEDSPNFTVDFYKEEYDNGDYLIENKDWGERMKLFSSLQAANDDIERGALKIWLREAAEWNKIQTYTLEQLRGVKGILEGQENGKNEDV